MHGNNLCHVRCYTSHASAATHPTLGGSCRMCDFDRMLTLVKRNDSVHMPDSGRISQLRSHFLISVDVTTTIVSPDSDRASWLRSMSRPHVLPPQLWKNSHGRARWLQHLTARILSQKLTRRDAWLIQRLKPQHLMASHVQVSGHVLRDRWTLSLAWSERNLSIQKDSVPFQLGRIKVFECLVRRVKALCRATMTLWADHSWEKSLAQQTEQDPDPGHRRLQMLYELDTWR
jgi:hypothetical protein